MGATSNSKAEGSETYLFKDFNFLLNFGIDSCHI